jgi:hypothetical protein
VASGSPGLQLGRGVVARERVRAPGQGREVRQVAEVLKHRAVPVQARDAGVDQQPAIDQLGEERPLLS